MMQLYFQIYVFFTIFQSLTCTNFVSFIFVSQLKHMEKTLFVNTVLIFSHLNRSCAGHLFANHSVPSAWIIRSGSMLCSSQSSNPVYYVVEGQQAFWPKRNSRCRYSQQWFSALSKSKPQTSGPFQVHSLQYPWHRWNVDCDGSARQR